MTNSEDIKKIKEIIEEFFQKMTVSAKVDLRTAVLEIEDLLQDNKESKKEDGKEAVEIDIRTDDPQILIGERGQTLIDIQRFLRAIVNKKLDKRIYLDIDINGYKKKKIDYLKNIARDLANEVALTGEARVLSPMPAYERRIVHAELSGRQDVKTESEGQGEERRIVIKPKKIE